MLANQSAAALVLVGSDREPSLRYCLSVIDDLDLDTDHDHPDTAPAHSASGRTHAIAVVLVDDRFTVLSESHNSTADPAHRLATRLADVVPDSATVLTPRTIPHDAACYLEDTGLSLTSTAVLGQTRARKTVTERDRIERAQTAAVAGVRRGASLLASATTVDGRLESDGEPVTASRMRRTIDEGIVAAGAFPGAQTAIAGEPAAAIEREQHVADPFSPGQPITVSVAPREPDGYHGGLTRTFVVAGEGGRERRAHVAVTRALTSAQSLLSTDEDVSVRSVEADLEAEIRAFGFETPAASVHGVGLEPRERPCDGGEVIDTGAVVRLEGAVDGIRVADLLCRTETGADWVRDSSRSLEPSSLA